MILGGLWHGANWTFLIWGTFHGALLAIHHGFRDWRASKKIIQKQPAARHPLTSFLLMALTFHAVCIGWVLFRASSIEQAVSMLGSMFNFFAPDFAAATLGAYLALCAILYLFLILEEHWHLGNFFERLPMPARAATLLIFLIILVIFVPPERVAFIYFQF
jgi:alginate O-acetyltransferase complex protein AlgI